MSTADANVFDVAADRAERFSRREKIWRKKRKELDAEIVAALSDAQAEADACQSNVKMMQVEELIKRRKLATSLAYATDMQKAAEKTFNVSRDKPYNLILIDPPWRYERTAHKCGTDTRYETMTNEQLAALPISGLAAEDAAIVVWTTYHMIESVSQLFVAWGFEIKTVFTDWIKVDRDGDPLYGQSSYTKPCSEFALLGVRGSLHVKSTPSVVNSVLFSRPRGHSRKPPVVRDMIVQLFGDLPRIELFARDCPPDWDVWGNQTDHFTNVWAREPDDDVSGRFLPCLIDRKKQRSDRVYKTDVAGAVETFARSTVGTSFGRLDNVFTNAATPVVTNAANDDHDHDGSRPCCRSTMHTVPELQLRNITRIESYMPVKDSPYAAVRNTLYLQNSEASVRRFSAAIKQQQRHNSDKLHALNHNSKRCPLVRMAAPGFSAATLGQSPANNKN